jgi:hypothetical protein
MASGRKCSLFASFWSRLTISPGSVSVLDIHDRGPSIRCLNYTGSLEI